MDKFPVGEVALKLDGMIFASRPEMPSLTCGSRRADWAFWAYFGLEVGISSDLSKPFVFPHDVTSRNVVSKIFFITTPITKN